MSIRANYQSWIDAQAADGKRQKQSQEGKAANVPTRDDTERERVLARLKERKSQ